MPEFQQSGPAAARALDMLGQLHDTSNVKQTAAAKYGEVLHGALDIDDGYISATKVAYATGINQPQVTEILKAFEGKALLVPSATPVATTRRLLRYDMTPQLIAFAGDYNSLFAEQLHALCPPDVSPQSLALRAIRSYAASRDVEYGRTETFQPILDRVVAYTEMHPQSVVYRSLGTCAFGMGILREAENKISYAARHWRQSVAAPNATVRAK